MWSSVVPWDLRTSEEVTDFQANRPLSRGGHFESQGNKKLCFSTSSLALNERLDVQNLLFEHCVIKVYTPIPEKNESYTETRLNSPRGRYSKYSKRKGHSLL